MNNEIIQIHLIPQYSYCKRGCSLRLLEGDNNLTTLEMIKGKIQHEKVHMPKIEKRNDVVKVQCMNIYSKKYGMVGICDLVELTENENGSVIHFLNNQKKYNIMVVEHKYGTKNMKKEYLLQVVAQSMCLEEMYNTKIQYGTLYHSDSRERTIFKITDEMRYEVLSIIDGIKEIIQNHKMYEPKIKKSCKKCALYLKCNPNSYNIDKYLNNLWSEIPNA